jgi:hypothetical protein
MNITTTRIPESYAEVIIDQDNKEVTAATALTDLHRMLREIHAHLIPEKAPAAHPEKPPETQPEENDDPTEEDV